MAGFFASLQANRSNSANAQANNRGLRLFGDSYEPFNQHTLTSQDVSGRKLVAARVHNRQQVNRQGLPYTSKEVIVFVAGTDGKPSKTRTFLKVRNDSPLQEGAWLNPNTIEIANMRQAGRELSGVYVQKCDEVAVDQVDADFKAMFEAEGVDINDLS